MGLSGFIRIVRTLCQGRGTLFGRYDAMDAVKTIDPLIPNRINALAAVRAV